MIKTWLPLAARAMVIDCSAYQEIVDDRPMNGPALFLGIGIMIVSGIFRTEQEFVVLYIIIRTIIWFFAVFAVFIVGPMLSRQGNYTRTLRGLIFAHVVYLVELVALIPPIAPLALFLGTVLGFISSWMGADAAHNTSGWRTIMLPY